MAVERRDPLPPGRYWIYLRMEEIEQWADWTIDHMATVKTVATQVMTITPAVLHDRPWWFSILFMTRPDFTTIEESVGEWVLFDVTAPTPWVGLGFPTIVGPDEMKKTRFDEFAQAPEPESGWPSDPLDQLKDLVLLAGGLYIGAMVFSRLLKS